MFVIKKREKKFQYFWNLYLGHENSKSGREFISYNANAVKERVAAILGSSDFLSILTNGKKGTEKKAVIKRWSLFAPNEMMSFLFIYIYRTYWRSSYIIIVVETELLVTKIQIGVPPPQAKKLLLWTLIMPCFHFYSFKKLFMTMSSRYA